MCRTCNLMFLGFCARYSNCTSSARYLSYRSTFCNCNPRYLSSRALCFHCERCAFIAWRGAAAFVRATAIRSVKSKRRSFRARYCICRSTCRIFRARCHNRRCGTVASELWQLHDDVRIFPALYCNCSVSPRNVSARYVVAFAVELSYSWVSSLDSAYLKRGRGTARWCS